MKVAMEVGRFVEVRCGTCRDTVYIKKFSSDKPVMLDD